MDFILIWGRDLWKETLLLSFGENVPTARTKLRMDKLKHSERGNAVFVFVFECMIEVNKSCFYQTVAEI